MGIQHGSGPFRATGRWPLVLACAALGIGVLWRCYRLDAFPGLDPDEVEGALAWFRDPPLLWYVYPSGRPHLNPLAPLVLWPFATLAAPAAWVVRMPAVLAGLALLPVTFLMVRKAFGQAAALPATVLAAAAPFLIAYSRQGWDLAYVPVFTALAIGFAFQRRLAWAAASAMLLALVHPTAAFVMVIVAAPFVADRWRRTERAPAPRRRRWVLAVSVAVACAALFLALSGLAATMPMRLEQVPLLVRLTLVRVFDLGLLDRFASAYWHALTGPLVYAEFLGSPVSGVRLLPGAALAAIWTAGVRILWRHGRRDELSLLVALPLALLAQYLTVGTPDLLVPLKERYFLWAVVPSCWAMVFVLDAFGTRLNTSRAALTVALAISAIWLISFYTSYLRPFAREGGMSASLDYRAAARQPKEQVLEIIRTHRRAPAADTTLFVGEGRLHLSLMYLASRDTTLAVRNLGRALYQTQRPGQEDLIGAFAAGLDDVFFVDYTWEAFQDDVRWIHATAARPVADVIAPWTAQELEVVRSTDGRPLLRVWRLSRPTTPASP